MLRRPCGRAMRSKGRVGVDAVASKPGVAKEVLPLTRRVLRLRLLKVGKLGEYDSLSHSRTEVRGRRGPRLNDRAPPRGSHTTLVWRSESSLHTTGPPVLLNSIIGTPGGRYMRLVTPLRAPFAAPIAPSHRGGLVHKPSSATPAFAPINSIPGPARLWFTKVVDNMALNPYEKWDSLWAHPPDGTCTSDFCVHDFAALPCLFYSPQLKFQSKGV